MTLLLFRLSSPSSQMKSSLNLTSQENRFCLHQSWILIFRKALTTLGRSAQHSLGSTRTSGTAKCLLVASAGKPRIKCPRKPSGAPARRRRVTSSVQSLFHGMANIQFIRDNLQRRESKINHANISSIEMPDVQISRYQVSR